MIISLSGLCLLTDMVPQAGADRDGAAYKAGQQHIVISFFVCIRKAGAGRRRCYRRGACPPPRIKVIKWTKVELAVRQVGVAGGSHVLADEAAPGQLHIIVEPAHLICILLTVYFFAIKLSAQQNENESSLCDIRCQK